MADSAAKIVFLFDVDNTLLDNDAVQADLSAHLQREFGHASRDRYWAIFEELRAQLGYADYLGALQRYRLENLDDQQLLRVSFFLVDYPFADRLYPDALAALARCASNWSASSWVITPSSSRAWASSRSTTSYRVPRAACRLGRTACWRA